MPHAPDTHITITPNRVYINGEPISVMKDTLGLSTPIQTGVQTVTLTICPTTVTILNEDNPDVINAAREAVTRTTRDEADSIRSTYIRPSEIADILNAWKR